MKVLYLTLILVISDQLTKIFIKGIQIPFLNIDITGMRLGQSFDVFGSFLRITFVENPGMAFGIDVGESSKLFLSLFSIVASIGIIIYLYKIRNESWIIRLALAFILAGALGNLVDRMFYGVIYDYAPIFYGSVVDFVNVDFFDFTLFGRTYDRFPIFNIADSSVTIGVFLLLIFHRSHEKVEEVEGGTELQTVAEPAVNSQFRGTDNEPLIVEEINEVGETSIQDFPEGNDGEDNNRKEIKN
ncbi:MAG: signal peptidase II [bacterium]